MTTTKTTKPMAAMVVAVWVFAAGANAQERKVDPPARKTPPKPKAETHPITVTGTAKNKDGKPIKAAAIHLLSVPPLSSNNRNAVLATTTTNDQGAYSFRDVNLPVRRPYQNLPEGHFQVYGTATGYGFAWHGRRIFMAVPRRQDNRDFGARDNYHVYLDQPITMDLTFGPAATLAGRLVGEDGNPISDGKVEMPFSCDYLYQKDKERGQHHRWFQPIELLPASMTKAVSDKDGRFKFEGLPQDALFALAIQHSDYAPAFTYAVTAQGAVPEDVELIAFHSRNEKPQIRTGDLNLTLTRPRRVTVQVVANDTGKPVTGVMVQAGSPDTSSGGFGVSTADGKLTLKLPPNDYLLLLDPQTKKDFTSDFIRTSEKLTVAKEPAEQTFTVRLKTGCMLTLEVVDADTGKGIPNVGFQEEMETRRGKIWGELRNSTVKVGNSVKTDANGKATVRFSSGKRRMMASYIAKPFNYEPVLEDGERVQIFPDGRNDSWGVAKEVELPEGKAATVRFKLRKK